MPIHARNIRATLIIKFIFTAFGKELPSTDDSFYLAISKLEKTRKKSILLLCDSEHCLNDTSLFSPSFECMRRHTVTLGVSVIRAERHCSEDHVQVSTESKLLPGFV